MSGCSLAGLNKTTIDIESLVPTDCNCGLTWCTSSHDSGSICSRVLIDETKGAKSESVCAAVSL